MKKAKLILNPYAYHRTEPEFVLHDYSCRPDQNSELLVKNPLAYTFAYDKDQNHPATDIPFVANFSVYRVLSPVTTTIDTTTCGDIPTVYRKVYNISDYPFQIDYNSSTFYFIPKGCVVTSLSGFTYTGVTAEYLMHSNTDNTTFTLNYFPEIFYYLPYTYYGVLIQNYISFYTQTNSNDGPSSFLIGNCKNRSSADYVDYFIERPYSGTNTSGNYAPADAEFYPILSNPIYDTRKRVINLIGIDSLTTNMFHTNTSYSLFYRGVQIIGYCISNNYNNSSVIVPSIVP